MEKYQEKAKEYEVSFLEILEKKESTFSWKDLVPYSFSKQHILSPVDCNDQGWVVAVLDPLNVVSIDTLYYYLKKPIEVVCAPKDEILKAIEHIYFVKTSFRNEIGLKKNKDINEEQEQDLLEQTKESPTVEIVNNLLKEAVRKKASDIHIESFSKDTLVRMRIDGVLHKVLSLDNSHQASVISRIKIMAQLDISQKRYPQDGSFKFNIARRSIDVRVSTIPTVHGERVVLRILDTRTLVKELCYLGMPEDMFNRYNNCLSNHQSMIVVTGPTGSGKTTTLYSSLLSKVEGDFNIMTIEDPVEYVLDGISQISVNKKSGLNFNIGLKHILRQDPDVIMVGEIRDIETLEIATRSSLTGHLVLTTLHTNNSVTAITRLLEMGIPSYIIASCVSGVLSQRLLRKICSFCKIKKNDTFVGKGCLNCSQTGYLGRVGVFEFLEIDKIIKESIINCLDSGSIQEVAERQGFKSMLYYAKKMVVLGITTNEEVLRILPFSSCLEE
jgi:type II secretory ATPase GspE/PulE/Tfp pilus assembly ATPase PilB-like protein